MKASQLEHLRKTRGLTREELAKALGGCTAQAIVKWERGERQIPAWVEEKMMRSIPVSLPLDELYAVLDEAARTGQSAEHIIGEALRLWLSARREAAAKVVAIDYGSKKEFGGLAAGPL